MSITIENTPTIQALGIRWEVIERDWDNSRERVVEVAAEQGCGHSRSWWTVNVRSVLDAVTGEWGVWRVNISGSNVGKSIVFHAFDRDECDANVGAAIDALVNARNLARGLNA